MKTFICALSILVVLSCAVTINAFYVQKHADELAAAIEALPDTPETADIAPIRAKWETLEPIVGFTISHKETDQLRDALTELESHQATGETREYHATRERLLNLVHRLSESEGFSVRSIF